MKNNNSRGPLTLRGKINIKLQLGFREVSMLERFLNRKSIIRSYGERGSIRLREVPVFWDVRL